MSEDIELDLTPEEYQQVIEIYMEENFTKESYSVYKDSKEEFQIAAFTALMNESLVDVIKKGMEFDEKP